MKRATNFRSQERWRRRRVLLLAALPLLDPIVNQVTNIYPVSLGSLSMLQVFRSSLLLIALAMTATAPPATGLRARIVGRTTLGICACLLLIAGHEFAARGELIRLGLVFYVQIAYWLTLWYLASSWITDPESARTVMKGLILGAFATAASVYYAYIAGATFAVYKTEGVSASAGWFTSGKGIAGSLLVGAFLTAYLGARRRKWASTAIALFCIGASALTYARAGMVGFGVAIVWLLIWSVKAPPGYGAAWARRLVGAAAVGVFVFLCTVGTADLIRRWSDVNQFESAGSGRLVLWRTAITGFLEGGAAEQFLGRGVQGQLEVMFMGAGVMLGAHNDFVEMLVIGGFAGIGILVLTLGGMLTQIRTARSGSPQYAAAIAIQLVFLCQMMLTGQFGLPDVMTYYLLAITTVLASARTGLAVVRPLRHAPAHSWRRVDPRQRVRARPAS